MSACKYIVARHLCVCAHVHVCLGCIHAYRHACMHVSSSLLCVASFVTAQHAFISFDGTAQLLREVRIYLSASYMASKLERAHVIRDALPQIRRHCENLCVSVCVIDLRAEVRMYHRVSGFMCAMHADICTCSRTDVCTCMHTP